MSLQSSNNDTPEDDMDVPNVDLNNELNEIELQNRDEIAREEGEYKYLYPSLDDPEFTSKISQRKEFYDTRYEKPEGTIEEVSDKLCNAEFELAPHQMFVRNFLSFQTPYNGLLLYHGLGSGKTCSAISVAEEMRGYLKQMGISQRIIVVASPNVQDNFRKQLFDESRLKLVDGLWNIRACTGNKFLAEINPMNMKGLTKDKVVAQVKRIINTSYLFLGYIEFANYVNKRSTVGSDVSSKQREKIVKTKLNRVFSNRLIIIDEVHNIRMTPDNSDKRVAVELEKLVENVENMRLLFLSATPMYNSYKEIVWLLNILNKNDRRATISTKQVFNTDGTFKINDDGEEVGRQLLARKATGYVSFVRGENPYTFPFRIWPTEFSPENTYGVIQKPTIQLNGRPITQPIEMLSVYLTNVGDVQQHSYEYILERLKAGAGQDPARNMPSFENMEAFGYTLLQRPLEALNMVYPDTRLSESSEIDPKDLVGKGGLQRIMKYKESTTPIFKGEFEYKSDTYGHIFSPDQIGKYSGKIKNICENIRNSKGVILIYSQYLDGGLVPIALALEEMGLKRAGSNRSLFKVPPTEEIDALSFKPKSEHGEGFNQASYVIISGDKALSPDNSADVSLATQPDNVDGSKVKVIMISQAGSEGIDFKFIRQVHVLDPWYNMNRIEQIIGRAVRTCSHKDLSFKHRNVEIFLYGSLLSNEREEAADIYLYRLAELKAVQIGNVSRVLKESSVDCLLNFEQAGFTVEQMNMTVQQELSNGLVINYAVGDRPFTSTCDYMSKCSYKCKPVDTIDSDKISFETYNESFITMNSDKIIQRIRDSFKESFYYEKLRLIAEINAVKNYPVLQINAALNQLTEDKNEFLVDMYGRMGRLINIGDLYLFQPLELNDNNISIYDRSVPVEYKRNKLQFEVPGEIQEAVIKIKKKKVGKTAKVADADGKRIIDEIRDNYTTVHTPQDIASKSDNWYAFCSLVFPHLEGEGWDRSLLDKLLVHHIIESLRFPDKLELLNYLPRYDSDDDMTRFIKEYFSENTMKAKGLSGIMLQNTGKPQLVVSRDGNSFTLAQPEDIIDFSEKINEMKATFMPMADKLAPHIGFMVNFKKDYMVFKIRDMSKPRNTGARCDQASKVKSVRFLNELGEEQYTTKTKMSRQELCVIQEFVLRKFELERKDEKRWFLRPSEAIIVNDSKQAF